MGLFSGIRKDPQREAQGGLLVEFASEAEVATVMARAESWARRTLQEAGIDPVEKHVHAVKALRQARPQLSLLEAVTLAKLAA